MGDRPDGARRHDDLRPHVRPAAVGARVRDLGLAAARVERSSATPTSSYKWYFGKRAARELAGRAAARPAPVDARHPPRRPEPHAGDVQKGMFRFPPGTGLTYTHVTVGRRRVARDRLQRQRRRQRGLVGRRGDRCGRGRQRGPRDADATSTAASATSPATGRPIRSRSSRGGSVTIYNERPDAVPTTRRGPARRPPVADRT